MSDEGIREFREVQAFFRLPSVGLVEKDLYVVRAIAALAAIDAEPFDLVFGGGTALARAYRIIRRMSEDVDFKIVPRPAAPVSRSALRRQLERLRSRVSAVLKDAGFAFDPADRSAVWARDEGRYAVWQLPYLILSTIHSAKGQEWRSVFVLNVVDGCIPSDLSTGTTEEIEEERRLLYVAMTRAKDSLHVIVPQRFFVSGQSALGDKHVYASRTRFIPATLLSLFECTARPVVAPDASRRAEAGHVKLDIAARMRRMWR